MNAEARRAVVPARRVHLVVAIDRFVARLLEAAPRGSWVVKGGYANDFRRPDGARFTEDLDLKIDAGGRGRISDGLSGSGIGGRTRQTLGARDAELEQHALTGLVAACVCRPQSGHVPKRRDRLGRLQDRDVEVGRCDMGTSAETAESPILSRKRPNGRGERIRASATQQIRGCGVTMGGHRPPIDLFLTA
jgi:hypothetical protein